MLTFLIWCLCFVALVAGAAALCYRLLRARGKWVAGLGAAVILALGGMLLPIPIHGGFTTPSAILWEEWQRERRRRAADEQEVDPLVTAQLARRFAGALAFSPNAMRAGLSAVSGAGFAHAWYEPESRLLWSEPLLWPEAPDLPSLEAARDFCARQAPSGYWALPTEGELYFFWRAGGPAVSPNPGFSTVAQLVEPGSGLVLPTYHRGRRAGYALRCVARGPGAPVGGYTGRDISLADWNQYQLRKAGAY